MKKVVLGLGMLFSGVVGIVGIMITSALDGYKAFGTLGFSGAIGYSGPPIYFFIFLLSGILSIAGLIIAIKAAYNNKQNP